MKSGATGKRLAVERRGNGPAVVMVHGLGGTANVWELQARVLARSFTVVRLDLEGSGRSPATGDLSVAGFAADVVAVMEAEGATEAHLVGHSMGTLVCQQVAATHPARVRSLALLGPLGGRTEASRKAMRDRAARARGEGMTPIADALVESALSVATRANNPAAIALAREMLMRQEPEGYARTCEALAEAPAVDLAAIACPTLLMTGDEDPSAPPSAVARLAASLADARMTVVPGSGHWLPIERPGEVTAALIDFYCRPASSGA